MKKTFKIASLILALVLAFCFGTVALAETAEPVEDILLVATAEAQTTAEVEATAEAQTTAEVVIDNEAGDTETGDEATITTGEEQSNPVSAPEGIKTAIIIVIALCAAVMIAVVLMQQTKSAGLGGAFGGDTQSFTARGKAASREAKLQKITLVTSIIIAALSILLAILD